MIAPALIQRWTVEMLVSVSTAIVSGDRARPLNWSKAMIVILLDSNGAELRRTAWPAFYSPLRRARNSVMVPKKGRYSVSPTPSGLIIMAITFAFRDGSLSEMPPFPQPRAASISRATFTCFGNLLAS